MSAFQGFRGAVALGWGVCGALLLATSALADAHEAVPKADPKAIAEESDAIMNADPISETQASAPAQAGATPDGAPPSPVDYAAANDPERYPDLDVPTKPWAYDTGYLFGLTRGLKDEVQSTWARSASMLGTVPLDIAGLPTAALAGLFGS